MEKTKWNRTVPYYDDAEWQKNMMQIEMRVSETEAFRAVAFFHHIIFSK